MRAGTSKLTLLALLAVAAAIVVAFWCWPAPRSGGAARDLQSDAPGDAGAGAELVLPESAQAATERRTVVTDSGRGRSGELSPAPSPGREPSSVVSILCQSREDGTPVPGVRVRLKPGSDSGWLTRAVEGSRGTAADALLSDETGHVEFRVDPGIYGLWAMQEVEPFGRANALVRVEADAATPEVVITLPTTEGQHFFGRVVSAETGLAMSEAQVDLRYGDDMTILDLDFRTRKAVQSLEADHDGLFEVLIPYGQTWSGRADAPGCGPGLFWTVAGHASAETALPVPLPRGARLDVTVNWNDSFDVRNLELWVRASTVDSPVPRAPEKYFEPELWRSDLHAPGTVSVADLPPGDSLTVAVCRQGRIVSQFRDPITLESGEVRAIRIEVSAGAVVRGVLVEEDGRPVADAPVWLASPRFAQEGYWRFLPQGGEAATTDSKGRFQFANVAAKEWRIGPGREIRPKQKPTDEVIATDCEPLRVSEGDTVVEVRLVAHRGLFVRGLVTDSEDRALPNAFVFGIRRDPYTNRSALTRPDGSFELGPLTPGSFELRAMDRGSSCLTSDPITARAGDSGVRFRLRRGGGVKGRVMDPDRKSAMASLELSRAADDSLSTGCGPDGRFEVTGISGGSWAIVALTTDDRIGSARFEVVAGEAPAEVEIVLRPAAHLRVHYLGPDEACFVVVREHGTKIASTTVARGDTGTLAVLAGSLDVELTGMYVESAVAKENRSIVLDEGGRADLEYGKSP